MRDSIRMRRNFESLSLRFVSRCLRTATAFLTRCQRSSGMDGANPIPKQKGYREGSKTQVNADAEARRERNDMHQSVNGWEEREGAHRWT